MKVVSVSAGSVRSALAAARRVLGVSLKGHREVLRSGGEDNLYRSTLESGDVVETTIMHHSKAHAILIGSVVP